MIQDDKGWIRRSDGVMKAVVSADSAILSLPAAIEEVFDAMGDHSTMVKLEGVNDGTYVHVCNALEKMLKDAEVKVPQRFCK